MSAPTLYFIRHGEKDTLPKPGFKTDSRGQEIPKKEDLDGLNSDGQIRAMWLPNIFATAERNIHTVLTPQFNAAGVTAQNKNRDIEKGQDPWANARPYQTTLPTVFKLKTQVPDFVFDHQTAVVDDHKAAAKLINTHVSENKGNILICWEHKNIKGILTKMGMDSVPDYPDNRFDIIYICEPVIADGQVTYPQITRFDGERVPTQNSLSTGALDAAYMTQTPGAYDPTSSQYIDSDN